MSALYTPSPQDAAGVRRGVLGGYGRWIAPQLRGHVEPRLIAYWRAQGWRVHQIGAAAYVHSPDDRWHFLFGVWGRRDAPPPWADRLGAISAAYVRRYARCNSEQRWRRLLRDTAGRFAVRLPWYRWPAPALYRFVPSTGSPWELREAAVAADNARFRADRGWWS
ncbi:MAG: hypothetical protein ACYDCL_21405 [Myxococcales bacterium]